MIVMTEIIINVVTTMKPYIEIASFVSAVLSIVAFIKSKAQAKIASDAAEQAVKVREDMIDRKKLVKTTTLASKVKQLLDKTVLFGRSATEKGAKGLDRAQLAKEIETLLSELLDYSRGVGHENSESLNKYIRMIETNVTPFTEESVFSMIKKHGTSIHASLEQVSSILELDRDNRTDNVSTIVNKEKT